MSNVNLNTSTLSATAITDWLKSKTVNDDTAAAFLSGRKVTDASGTDATLSNVTVVTSLNHAKGATLKELSRNARREFLSFIKASCGLPDSAPIDKLPLNVQKAMKCTGFVGLFKKGDWDASNGRPLTARRIKAVMTALEAASVRRTADAAIGKFMDESVQPHIDKGWITRGKFDALCRRLADCIERNLKEDLPGELEGNRGSVNPDEHVTSLVRVFCQVAVDGVSKLYDEVLQHFEKSVKTLYPDEKVRETKMGKKVEASKEINTFVTAVALLEVVKRHPVLAKTWAFDLGRDEFVDPIIDKMASTKMDSITGWPENEQTQDRFAFLQKKLETVMRMMAEIGPR